MNEDMAYRPGLPTLDQVRAHEECGGWWQAKMDRRPRLRNVRRFISLVDNSGHVAVGDGNDGNYFGHMFRKPLGDWDTEADLRNYEMRPCFPDGTPCPWPVPMPD